MTNTRTLEGIIGIRAGWGILMIAKHAAEDGGTLIGIITTYTTNIAAP